jgi:hypothetical protein
MVVTVPGSGFEPLDIGRTYPQTPEIKLRGVYAYLIAIK